MPKTNLCKSPRSTHQAPEINYTDTQIHIALCTNPESIKRLSQSSTLLIISHQLTLFHLYATRLQLQDLEMY